MTTGQEGLRLLRITLLGCLLCLLGASSAWAAPAWLAPTNLSAPGKNATGSEVAMDEAGETVAVWQRQSETEINSNVQASTRGPGEGFSAPLELSKAASEPAVAMTPSGEAVAVWRHFDIDNKGNYVIQASTRPPGGSFSAPLDVAVTPNEALPQDLHVVVNAAGDTAVVWTQQEPGSGLSPNPTFVDASVRPAGGSFSAPTTISTLPLVAGQSARTPRVAIDTAGDVAVVWGYDNGTNNVIEASTSSSGTFSSPVDLSASGEDAATPAIAMTPAGEATVVWTRSNGTNDVIEASTASSGGSFSSPIELSDAAQSAFEPEVTVDPGGTKTVVWTRSNGTNDVIEVSTASPSGSFTAPVELSEIGQSALDPAVAHNPGGVVTVVWRRFDGANEIVQASTASSGGGFSAPVNLSAGGQDAVFPAVAMDSAGDATVVWWRSDGSNEIVQAAGYDADAPELRNLSIPASGMVGVPVSFSASPFDIWPIAATSFSFGDGATAAGTSVSHTYSAPGTYQVTVTSKDAAGTPVAAGAPIAILPSNDFRVVRLSLSRKKGTGTFVVTIPGPGKLVLSGKGVKRATKRFKRAGTVKLPIGARGKALKSLSKRGKVRVPVAIAFTPDGGTTLVKHKKVTLIKKLPPSQPRNPSHA